jgi:mannose-1-phosphate guanylyltransferase
MNTSLGLGQKDRWAVILAGGEGNRLRSYIHRIAGRECPKQFFPVLGTGTLLEQTLARVSLRMAPERTLTVVNHAHEEFYSAISNARPELNLVVQHDSLGTAPAIVYSLLAIAKRSPDASVAIFPSDHYVGDAERFMDYVGLAFDSITRRPEAPMVLGIVPDNAQDGYGWIERGHLVSSRREFPVYRISRFWEKPALEFARELYHRSCLWNTFVIVGSVSWLLGTIEDALPGMYASLNLAQVSFGNGFKKVMTRAIYHRSCAADFSQSVLARHAYKFAVMPIPDVEWSDLGDPERVIALRSREIEISPPTAARRLPIPVDAALHPSWARHRLRSAPLDESHIIDSSPAER